MFSDATIAICGGTGNVGIKLAKVLLANGHSIVLGSRSPAGDKAKAAVERLRAKVAGHGPSAPTVAAMSNADAAAAAGVIFLAFPSQRSVEEVRRQAALLLGPYSLPPTASAGAVTAAAAESPSPAAVGAPSPSSRPPSAKVGSGGGGGGGGVRPSSAASHAPHHLLLKGKVVVDLTNPVTHDPSFGNPLLERGTSAGEEFDRFLGQGPKGAGAHVYKTLNTIGAQFFGEPGSHFGGRRADMLYAGPFPSATDPRGEGGGGGGAAKSQATVEALLAQCGFRPVLAGPIRYARNLEAIAELWVGMMYVNGARAASAAAAGGKAAAGGARKGSSPPPAGEGTGESAEGASTRAFAFCVEEK